MSNIITGRQLRAAHILAGLTQKQLAKAVGVHERAARYWELRKTKHQHRRRVRWIKSRPYYAITA
jgi:DNA-binding XRE family transcriptional regulator